ncbi:MAG: FG-GAP-like repeat-containing protein [Candidatus Eisenbacteria bacterium]
MRRLVLPVWIAASLLALAAPASSSILLPTEWSRIGSQAGMNFGQCVAPAGDVDGDGHSDVLVGAPTYSGPFTRCGIAYLHRGSVAGPGASPAWQFAGTQGSAAAGTSVASAGDVNGDGYDDVLVGAPLYNTPSGADAGRVWLFLGSAAGLAVAPSQTLDGPSTGARYGFSVAPAGDVDADGYADVLIGAPNYSDQNLLEGAVFLLRGGPAGLAAASWSKTGGQDDARLGFSVSGAGDVDADGFDDVIVGAPGTTFNFTADGTAFVYRGSASGLLLTSAADLHGFSDSCAFGASVSRAGDINGDGYADVLIGAPNASNGGPPIGYASVWSGSPGGLGGALWESYGIEAGESFGVSVATAGDLNGDSYADFVVGGDRWPSPLDRVGRASVWLGGAGSPTLDADFQGSMTAEGFGFSVATAGDVDDDGFSDLLLGQPGLTTDLGEVGRVAMLRGSASKPVAGAFWPQVESEPLALFGLGLAGGIDERRFGIDNLFIGAPLSDQGFSNAGRIRIATAQIPSPVLNGGFLVSGEKADARLGTEMARAGDVNGDLYEDLLVGSPLFSNGQGDEGLAQLFLGGSGGLSSTPAWRYETNLINDQVGRSVAAGDFNGDGYNDLLVGVFTGSAFGNDGSARVFRGSASGPELAPSWSTLPTANNSRLGFEVATGDWDADGYADAAVGAPSASHGETGEGQVLVYFGGPLGLGTNPTWVLETNVANSALGYSLANAGDVDGDGVGDLLMGAPNAFGVGRAYLVRGSRSRSVPRPLDLRAFAPDVPTTTFGNAVAGIGDVDKDGYADILVGAPQHSGGQTNEGGVWLYRGSRLGGGLLPWWKQESNVVEARFGSTLARMGDANGDGWPDFAVGAPYEGAGGAVHVYHAGGSGRLVHGTYQAVPFSVYLPMGATIPSAGTTLAPGVSLRSAAGRVRGHIELQVGTQNEAWGGGVHTLHGPYDTGTPDLFGSLYSTQFAYPGLAPGLAWRWRNRSVVASPFFPHSPWRQPRAFETAEPHFRTGGTNVAVEPAAGRLTGARLSAIEPSPFRDGTRIRFRLARAADVRLDVHDARGRHVRRLLAARLEPGAQFAAFDGLDDAGRPLAAGIYFVSIEAEGARDTRKVVRLP